MKRVIPVVGLSLTLPFAGVALAQSVDVNQADAEGLAEAIDGVGEVRSQAIVEYREANGPFPDVEALTEVDGIGPATLEANRDRLSAGSD